MRCLFILRSHNNGLEFDRQMNDSIIIWPNDNSFEFDNN
jgi:hypothetical protein